MVSLREKSIEARSFKNFLTRQLGEESPSILCISVLGGNWGMFIEQMNKLDECMKKIKE